MGYAFRIEHMYWGMLRTIDIMQEIGFKPETILKVVGLVGTHDQRKCIQNYKFKSVNEELLNVSDAKWMETNDGIKRDIERAIENDLDPMNEEEQLKYNQEENKELFEKVGV